MTFDTLKADPKPRLPSSPAHKQGIVVVLSLAVMTMLFLIVVVQSYLLVIAYTKPPTVIAVTFDDYDNQVITIEQKQLTVSDRQFLTEMYLTSYIRNRETIDHTTTSQRRDLVQLFTNEQWFELWAEQMDPSDPESPIGQYARQGLSREIANITITPDPSDPIKYTAEFEAIDRQGQKEISRKRWLVSLEAVSKPIRGDRAVLQANPIGLTVFNYILREANTR